MTVASVYENGGIIGQTLDFGATDFYQNITGTQNDSFTIEATATAADRTNDSEGVTIPAATQEGDLLVVACGHVFTPVSEANMAAGWTVLANSDDNQDGTPNVQSVILYKIATSSDAGQTFIMGASGGDIDIDYKMFVLRPDNAAITSGTTFTTGEDSYKTFNNPPQLSVNPSGSSGPVFAIAAYAVNTGSQPSASPTPTGDQAVDGTDFYVSHWVYSRADTKPSSITWDASDGGRNAVSLAYIEIPDAITVTNANRKNSGIWNLEAVYRSLAAARFDSVEYASATRGSSSTMSFDYPSNIDSGDILILVGSHNDQGGTPSVPSGWTNDNTGAFQFCISKVADGTETGSLSYPLLTKTEWIGQMYVVKGKNLTQNFESLTGAFSSTGSVSETAPTGVGSVDLYLYHAWHSANRTENTAVSNMTNSARYSGIFAGAPTGAFYYATDIGGETISNAWNSGISWRIIHYSFDL